MKIEKDEVLEKIKELKEKGFNYLVGITGIDYVKYIEVIYFLRKIETNEEEKVEVELSPDNPKIKTIISVFPSADWYERELMEMFGIEIEGRKAKRLLLEKRKEINAPLRKSFQWGKYDNKN
ncbi:MAG: NADH-quinone oxidoreductase subunit C [Candidatus Micrarchaeaceae archaeon]